MTEDKAIEATLREGRGRTIYSFLCVSCGDIGFTARSERFGFCSAGCRNKRSGPLSPAWKGGRTTTRDGYVWLLGKKFEHRAVMEAHIGRSLLPNENVHHKNGVRSDNRIENLELWTKPPTPGQRPSDLVEFVADHYEKDIRAKLEIKDLVRRVLSRLSTNKTLADIPNSEVEALLINRGGKSDL